MMHSFSFLETLCAPSGWRIKGGQQQQWRPSCRGDPCSHPSSSPAHGSLSPRSTIKVPAATLATLLLMAICSPAEAHLSDSSVAVSSKMPGGVFFSCCYSYEQRPIPRSLITSAYMTSSMCRQPGATLVTKKGKTLCADAQAKWVQAYLKYFQMQES